MITSIILNILFYLISFLLTPLRAFNDVVLSSNFSTSLATASGYYNSLNAILPMDTMIEILTLSLAIEGAYLLFKVIMWVIGKIPMIN
jgi:hypothetical protein